jgi:hypothetical protein
VRSELKLVTVDGYDSAARKYSCEATMAVTVGNSPREARVAYEVQTVQGQGGQFLVKMKRPPDEAASFFREHALKQYRKQKYGTQWSGEYACGGVNGDTSDTRGPFSMKVTAAVDADWHMVLERATLAAGKERVEGTLEEDGSVTLAGQGANEPEDRWRSEFEGQVQRETLTATGKIVALDTSSPIVRDCKITLKRVDPAASTTASGGGATLSATAAVVKP